MKPYGLGLCGIAFDTVNQKGLVTMYLEESTNEQIIAYASTLGQQFDDEAANDVRNTACSWYGRETMQEAVQDYINAYGG